MSEESTASVVTETPVTVSSTGVETVDVTPRQESEAVTEAPKVEEVKTEEAPKKELVSPKLSQIKQREAAAAAREAAAEQKLAEAQAKYDEAQQKAQLLEKLKTTPTKALADLGITFNDIAQALLNEKDDDTPKTPNEVEEVKKKLENLESSIAAEKQAALDAADAASKAQLNAAIEGIKVKINEYVNADPEKYDFIITTKNQDLVYDVMEAHWQDECEKKGWQKAEIMSYTDACDKVEEWLTEQAVTTLGNSKKLQKHFSPPKVSKSSFGKTLSSQLTQMAAANETKPDLSKLSHEERIKVLAKGIRFN